MVATLLAVLTPPPGRDYAIEKGPGYEWVAVTPEGFFDASTRGAELLTVVRGLEAVAINASSHQILHRPDLVRAKLAGDPDGKVKRPLQSWRPSCA